MPYSIPTDLLQQLFGIHKQKTFNNKIRNKIIKYSQLYILSKQSSGRFSRLYSKSMNDNKKDNDEYKEIVKVYEDYKKNKKNNLSSFQTKVISIHL